MTPTIVLVTALALTAVNLVVARLAHRAARREAVPTWARLGLIRAWLTTPHGDRAPLDVLIRIHADDDAGGTAIALAFAWPDTDQIIPEPFVLPPGEGVTVEWGDGSTFTADRASDR